MDARIRDLERLAKQGDDAAWVALQSELARRGALVDYGRWGPLVNDIWIHQSSTSSPALIGLGGSIIYWGEVPYSVSREYLRGCKDNIQRVVLVHPGYIDRLILIALLFVPAHNNLSVLMKNTHGLSGLRATKYLQGYRLQVIDAEGHILGGGIIGSKWPTEEAIEALWAASRGV